MQEKNTRRERLEQANSTIDERLSGFYGPERTPQQLPSSSWQALQRRINKQLAHRSFYRIKYRGQRRHSTPLIVQQAFVQVLHEPYGPTLYGRVPELRCSFKRRLREPAVHTTLLSNAIYLTLPSMSNIVEDGAALDVLLAAGLARYQLTQQWRYRWLYLLILFLLLADGAAFMVAHFYQQWFEFLIVGIATLGIATTLYWQRRQKALQADRLAVRWLGRSRMCQGLHALTNYSRAPYRRHWNEPSLTERIERVCGPRVEDHDEHLTMVR